MFEEFEPDFENVDLFILCMSTVRTCKEGVESTFCLDVEKRISQPGNAVALGIRIHSASHYV